MGDDDQDDDGDGSKTVVNEGDTVKVTPFKPNPGDTVCIDIEFLKENCD